MASSFDIDCEWDRDRLSVSLLGDFGEASAEALVHTLEENCRDASVVFIKAKDVRNLDATGCDAFKKKLHVLNDWCCRLVLMDQNALRLKPEWTEFF